MDRTTAAFVDGLGAATATSGVLTQLQGRIFALLYLHRTPLSLDEVSAELQQSKSNISINIRALVEWHLVRRKPVGGSRKDHYEAATDFFRTMQEILERRFRWTVRQVLATVSETKLIGEQTRPRGATKEQRELVAEQKTRLEALGAFFSLLDAGIGAFLRGESFPAQKLQNLVALPPRRARGRT